MTVTAPVAVGDDVLAEHINLFLNRPRVRLVQAAVQSIPDVTATALTFAAGSEDVDSHNYHDVATNSQRITPTQAGWFTFRGMLVLSGMTTPVTRSVQFRKNGVTLVAPSARDAGAASITNTPAAVSALIQCNGSTDYVELVVTQDSAGAVNTSATGQLSSVFECLFESLS